MSSHIHVNSEYPTRGSRRIRGASFDVSETNKLNILNFPLAHYVCLALENCPETGRPHYQFYIVCKNTVRLSTLRAHIKDAGFQACDASHMANILYVLKQRDEDYEEHKDDDDYHGNDDTFCERGERPDERAAAARTLDSFTLLQNYCIATHKEMHPEIAKGYEKHIVESTDALCRLLDIIDVMSSDEDDEMNDMNDRPLKKQKI